MQRDPWQLAPLQLMYCMLCFSQITPLQFVHWQLSRLQFAPLQLDPLQLSHNKRVSVASVSGTLDPVLATGILHPALRIIWLGRFRHKDGREWAKSHGFDLHEIPCPEVYAALLRMSLRSSILLSALGFRLRRHWAH